MSENIYEVPKTCPICSSNKCRNVLHCWFCKDAQATLKELTDIHRKPTKRKD